MNLFCAYLLLCSRNNFQIQFTTHLNAARTLYTCITSSPAGFFFSNTNSYFFQKLYNRHGTGLHGAPAVFYVLSEKKKK